MADTAVEALEALEATLLKKESAILAALSPIQHELLVTRRALSAARGVLPASNVAVPSAATIGSDHGPLSRMTMKDLVRHALEKEFPDGATANDLVEAFHSWGRTDIIRSSLSPQLSRLKRDEEVDLHGYVWHLRRDQPELPISRNENGPPVGGPDAGGVAAPSSDTDEFEQLYR